MNPEQLRRALARRNEATHPVESDDACHVCGLDSEHGDPVGHFKDPVRFGEYVLAHGDCGAANGLELA